MKDPFKRIPWKGSILGLLLLGLVFGGGYLLLQGDRPAFWPLAGKKEATGPEDRNGAAGRPEPLLHVVQPGDSLFNILDACGVPAVQIAQVVQSVRGVYDLAALTAGNTLKIWLSGDEPVDLLGLHYEIDDLNDLEVVREGPLFRASRKTHAVTVRLERAAGTITDSLYASAVGAGVSPEIVMALTDIFAWDVNFFTDVRAGDAYTVLYEGQYLQERRRGYGKILAARFVIQGREHVALYYRSGGRPGGYYDAEGRPIQKLFLKAPLTFRRISSGFSFSRRHPVFNVRRPHLGVDYAAPAGTPVVALGGGTVAFRGWAGGFGKAVRITHPSGYVTHYGHLSGYAKGLRKGARVVQGQVIGYVGSTGVSTGPHLDFRVSRRGRFINPLTLRPVNAPPLKGGELQAFRDQARQRLALLDGQTAVVTPAGYSAPGIPTPP